MARIIWQPVLVHCSNCGHRNRPHNSALESAILLLEGWNQACRGCGKMLNPNQASFTRPIFDRARLEIINRQNANNEKE